ncbi:MAG: NosD domain-containing protein, partial [Promethearchaeota archaeon]
IESISITNSNYISMLWNVINTVMSDQLLIDDFGGGNLTWSQSINSLAWISGMGTYSDPYAIRNIIFSGQYRGDLCLEISNVHDPFVIENCIFTKSETAFRLFNVANLTIRNNDFVHNTEEGLFLSNCINNTIENNYFLNNSLYPLCVALECQFNKIINNSFQTNSYISILLSGCDSNIVSDNTIESCDYGVKTDLDVSNNTISNNIISNVGCGVWITSQGNNIIISDNNITNAYRGVYLDEGSFSNNITGNRIIDGIGIGHGISLFNTRYNLISGNLLLNNLIGINVNQECEDNTITQNSIYSNIEMGVFINSSSNNTLYYNFFIKNGINAEDNGTTNFWDRNRVGNSWDDYYGSYAINGTGIDPYNISGTAGSRDRYPILDTEPQVDFYTNTSTIIVGQTVKFIFNGTGDFPLRITWRFGENVSTNILNPECVFSSAGIFKVTLIVTDINLNTSIIVKNVTVINQSGPQSNPELLEFILYLILSILVVGMLSLTFFIVKRRKNAKTLIPEALSPGFKGSHKIKKNSIVKQQTIQDSVANVHSSSSKEEKEKTESEVKIEKRKVTCIVHKGPIIGPSYVCPICEVFYCMNCVKMLKSKGDKCWSCHSDFKLE